MMSYPESQSKQSIARGARWNPFSAPLPTEQLLYERLHSEWLVRASLVVLFVLGVAARLAFRRLKSGDYTGFLSPWYDTIEQGGVAILGQQVGDYNILYQFAIYIMTLLPLPKLYAYKALSCMFDIVLAATCGQIGRSLALRMHKDEQLWGTLAFSLAFLSPTVVLNSSAWAQCDSIYTAFCLLSLLELMRERNLAAFLLLGVAFCFKLQAVFLVPIYAYAAIADKRYSLVSFVIIPLVMICVSLPFVPLGRNVLDTFRIYAGQMGTYSRMSLNFPNLWMACVPTSIEDSMAMYEQGGSHFAVALTAGTLFLEAVVLMRHRIPVNDQTMIPLTLLFSLTCVVMLPAMHERYAYLVDVLAILAALMESRLILPAGALNLASLMTTIRFLFQLEFQPDYRWLSVAYVMLSAYVVMTIFSLVCDNGSTEDATIREAGF